ncbi:beta-1,2-xylosyltransferase XYXT1-like [Triticum aestivum]|uniref:beta-1,2-xylosyltransferase XYXT1-like n=1 Tax=Triticum aestivum TaxID=4565 RepID=UPI001D027B6F|nr:beta-1,2-xylosyltransferase XYXT1-like [Triticum aestivum]
MAGDWSSSSSTAAVPSSSGMARRLARHHQAVLGFLLGFFVSVVLYTTVSGPNSIEKRSAWDPKLWSSPPNNSTQAAVHDIENGQKDVLTKTMGKERQTANDASGKLKEELIRQELDQDGTPLKPICDLSDPRYDICEISGDARAIGANCTVLYVPPADERGPDGAEWTIRDQSRKDLGYIDKVNVKTLSAAQSLVAPGCTSRHAVPAVVFAMNGLTSNPWHDFSDVLIPLFITTRAYDGEVQFLVTDFRPWFVDKYRLILTNLSRYDIIDFNKDTGVRCYPHIVVGLRSHSDLGIDPTRTPYNYTMLDFRMYIRDVFSLPPEGQGIPFKEANKKKKNGGTSTEEQKPRLMLINRAGIRKFVNLPEISAAVQAAGFEVLVVEPLRDMRLEEFSREVDSCDVLMGAHGAALTSFFFLRTNAVMLQVVPWGLEREAMSYFGVHAKDMMLQDMEYSITVEESTLYEKYGKDHLAVRDPEALRKQGWQLLRKYLWDEQDIRLNVTRFSPTLHQLLRTLGE